MFRFSNKKKEQNSPLTREKIWPSLERGENQNLDVDILQNTLIDTITESDLSSERIATTKGCKQSFADGAAVVVPTSW